MPSEGARRRFRKLRKSPQISANHRAPVVKIGRTRQNLPGSPCRPAKLAGQKLHSQWGKGARQRGPQASLLTLVPRWPALFVPAVNACSADLEGTWNTTMPETGLRASMINRCVSASNCTLSAKTGVLCGLADTSEFVVLEFVDGGGVGVGLGATS